MVDLTFRILEQGLDPREMAVTDGLTIGRHPDSACPLSDPLVSGRHARVVSKGGALHYEHTGSSNQTKASSGAELSRGESIELTAGLELTLGGTSFQVVGPDAMPASKVDAAAQEDDEFAVGATMVGTVAPEDDATSSAEEGPGTSTAEIAVPAKAEEPAPKAEAPAPKAEAPAPKAEAPVAKPEAAAEKPAAKAEAPAPKEEAPAEKPAAKAEKPAAEKPAAEKPAAAPKGKGAKTGSKDGAEKGKSASAMPAGAPTKEDLEEDVGGQTMLTMAAGADSGLTDIAKLAKFQDLKPRLGIHSDADALRGIHEVTSLEFTIGRSERRNPELRVDHEGVSGEHATIAFDGRRFRVLDRNSTNGTRVNDEALPAAGSKDLLSCDMWLSFGPIDALFVADKDHQARGPQTGLYDRAVETLVQQHKITSAQSDEAKAQARSAHEHVGLVLTCTMGVVSPRDWMDSLELARIQLLSGSSGGGGGVGGGSKKIWIVLALVAAAAAAVYFLS